MHLPSASAGAGSTLELRECRPALAGAAWMPAPVQSLYGAREAKALHNRNLTHKEVWGSSS